MIKQKKISIVLVVAVVISLFLLGGAWFLRYLMTGQTGNIIGIDWYSEEQQEFILYTEKELYEFAELSYYYDFKGQTVKLGTDIVINEGNAADWDARAPKKKWFGINGFAGTFEGQGYSISGLYSHLYDRPTGLFTETQVGCVIRDVRLLNSYFWSSGNMGTGSISSGGAGSFEKIYSDAIIVSEGFYTAGIMGQALGKTVFSECWFDGSVKTEGRFCGGIVSNVQNTQMLMEHCLNSGELTSSYTLGSATVGGLCGINQTIGSYTEIRDSLNVGIITTLNTGRCGSVIGGVGTDTDVKIECSFATMESYKKAVGQENGHLTGGVFQMQEITLTGTEAYRWTTLDFEHFWSCVQDGTPVLSCFVETPLSLESVAQAYDISWYNEDSTEYEIATREQLYGMTLLTGNTDFANKTVKLVNDIILNEGRATDWRNEAPEYNWISAMKFAGTFDGQGHQIEGLYQKTSSNLGLFSKTTQDAVIKNLKLTNSYISATSEGDANVGSIAAIGGGIFEKIYSDAIIDSAGNFCGGIVGQINVNATTNRFTNCWFDGTIATSGRGVGGIVSCVKAGTLTVEHCLSSGTINSTFGKTTARAGGICGIVMTSGEDSTTLNVTDCLSSAIITALSEQHVGSVLGRAADNTFINLKDVYATNESSAVTVSSLAEKSILDGVAAAVSEKGLIGYGGYQRTSLDFVEYWAVVLEGTPILKCFADQIPTIPKDMERAIIPDTSWYRADKKSYTIQNAAQLLGVALMSSTDDFSGKSIILEADIILNNGEAMAWKDEEPISQWTMIGSSEKPFAGEFDGNGHSISGIYYSGKDAVGMFGATSKSANVHDFKLINSYFCAIDDNGMTMGSIVARGGGKIDSVYSDAIMVSHMSTEEGITENQHVGGIIGLVEIAVSSSDNQITNCWFDGSIDSLARQTGGIVGTVRENSDKTATVGLTIAHCLSSANMINNTFTASTPRSGGICGFVYGAIGSIKLIVRDSLSLSVMTCKREGYVCAALGRVTSNTAIEIDNVYVSTESCARLNDMSSGTTIGEVYAVDLSALKGYGAYQRTRLNFEEFWTVVLSTEPSTPILQKFAVEIAKIPTMDRVIEADTSWFEENKSTYYIDTVEKLYGFAELSKTTDFAGKIIKLTEDLTINKCTIDYYMETPLNTWNPISSAALPFAGTFDGQGHFISGIYCSGNDEIGLFGATAKTSRICNLELKNSYFCSADINGLALGSISARGGGLFENVQSSAYILTTNGGDETLMNEGHYVGGIVGIIDLTESEDINIITNCYFTGSIKSVARQLGGMVGAVRNRTENTTVGLTVEHSMNRAVLMKSTYTKEQAIRMGGLVGFVYGEKGTAEVLVEDCMNATKIELVLTKQSSRVRIGALVGALAGTYKATIERSYALLNTWSCLVDSTASDIVIENADIIDEKQLIGYGGYSNTKLEFDNVETEKENDGHWVAKPNGIPELRSFTNLDDILDVRLIVPSIVWYSEAVKDADNNEPGTVENPYILSNAADLYGFAQLVNDGTLANKNIVVQLGANIEVNKGTATDWIEEIPINNWIPIGNNAEHPFIGTFDGQGYTVKGIYCYADNFVGLFGVTVGESKIQNLLLTNSCFVCDNPCEAVGDEAYVGSIVARGGGSITSVYTDAMIVTTNAPNASNFVERQFVGGIVGMVDARADKTMNKISNCWFEGSVESIARQIGGIVGAVRNQTKNTTVELTIEHCLSAATALNSTNTTKTTLRMGGLCGFVYGMYGEAELYVDDCLNISPLSVSCSGNQTRMGAIVGALAAKTDQGGAYIVNVNNTYAENGTWTAAFDTTGTVVVTETVRGVADRVTETEYRKRLFAESVTMNQKPLDFESYWNRMETTFPVLRYKGVTVPEQTVIRCESDLRNFATAVNEGKLANKNVIVKLANDVTLDSSVNWQPIGDSADNPFGGIFDGQGYKISGINCAVKDKVCGFFGYTTKDSQVMNLRLEDSTFSCESNNGETYIGSVVAIGGGSITSVYSNATIVTTNGTNTKKYVEGQFVGGIIGMVDTKAVNRISNCWFEGTVESIARQIGGIVGAVRNQTKNTTVELTIEHCLSAATALNSTNTTKTTLRMGGLCGFVYGMYGEAKLYVDDSLNISPLSVSCSGNQTRMGAIVGALAAKTDQGGAYIVNVNNTYAENGTWTAAFDTTGTVTVTETVANEVETIIETDYAHRLFAEENALNSRSLDYATYWITTETTPELKYKGVAILPAIQSMTLFGKILDFFGMSTLCL